MPLTTALRLPFGPELHIQNPIHPEGGRISTQPGRGTQQPYDTLPKPMFPRKPGENPAGFIALGDSYSAGIGTGANGTEGPCRRGIHAYPELVNADLVQQEGENSTSFQFLSCTGSTIGDLLLNSDSSQIEQFNTTSTADFALLSIGGNDLGFFDIMNSCIFRFYSFYSGTCEEALRRSEEQLASSDFENHLRLAMTELLDRVHWEKRPWFTITVTGYARFFNDQTHECDDSSFGVWWRGPKLKQKLRRRMNEMVLAVNDKIRQSVDAVNVGFAKPKVFFVDHDHVFDGHRFCEPNVTEPDYGRNETWFFLVGGPDNAAEAAIHTLPGHNVHLPPTSPLIDTSVCMEFSAESGDWGEKALCMMATAAERDPSLRYAEGDVVGEASMWFVPTYYGQTFHPVCIYLRQQADTLLKILSKQRTKAHGAIRDEIYRRWKDVFGVTWLDHLTPR